MKDYQCNIQVLMVFANVFYSSLIPATSCDIRKEEWNGTTNCPTDGRTIAIRT